MKNKDLTDTYSQYMTKASFEKSQNNTGNTEGLMTPTPAAKLALQRKEELSGSVCVVKLLRHS